MGAQKSLDKLASITPEFFDNSNIMDGSVVVAVFLLESTGAIDTNYYSWTQADQDTAIAQAVDGLNWWVDQARAFNLGRPLVAGEENSPFVHALSAADLAGGISAIVDLRVWTFVNADLTVTFWRTPRPPWILLSAATAAGDQGTGVTRGELSDVDGPFGACMQTLIFERRPASPRA